MYDELVKRLRIDQRLAKFAAEDVAKMPNTIFGEAADAIEELSKPRWIPVTEQFPLYGDWVLGIGPKKGYYVCEYRGITHFPYSGDSPWFSAKGRSLTITHWMPLPEPPKEET